MKNATSIGSVPHDCVISIEYSLPTDGMAIDLIFAGYNTRGEKTAIIVESKQWNDTLIHSYSFSAYREDGKELHPQVQIGKHRLSFSQYLDIGNEYSVIPIVFIRNCSFGATQYLSSVCPRNNCKSIPITNSMDFIIQTVIENEIL